MSAVYTKFGGESRPDTFGRSIHDIEDGDSDQAIRLEPVLRFHNKWVDGLDHDNLDPEKHGQVVPLAQALLERADEDAWITPYLVIDPDGEVFPHPPRVNKEGLDIIEAEGGRVEFWWVLIDVDGPKDAAGEKSITPGWREAEAEKLRELRTPPSFYYDTKGGYRFGWRLASPLSPIDYERFIRWLTGLKTPLRSGDVTRAGIKADPACLHWSCCFFVPSCVKDGTPRNSEHIGLMASRLDPEATREKWVKVTLSQDADRDRTPIQLPPIEDVPGGDAFSVWLLQRLKRHLDARARKLAAMPQGGRATALFGDAADLGRDVQIIAHYWPDLKDRLLARVRADLLEAVAQGAILHGIADHDPAKAEENIRHGFAKAERDPRGQPWLEDRLKEFERDLKNDAILAGFAKMGGAR